MTSDALTRLETLLKTLPSSLPLLELEKSSYQWQLDEEFLQDEGVVPATNQMLERVVGMRASGIKIRERGMGIQGVVKVFEGVLQHAPRDAIMEKWIEDMTEAARQAHVDGAPSESASVSSDLLCTIKTLLITYRRSLLKGLQFKIARHSHRQLCRFKERSRDQLKTKTTREQKKINLRRPARNLSKRRTN